MKLLVACSSLDLNVPLSATPAWWQLLKALDELGAQLVVTTYQGNTPSAPWWRTYPNPARLEGDLFHALRNAARRFHNGEGDPAAKGSREPFSQRFTRAAVRNIITPRWEKHLLRILAREQDVACVLLLGIPPNHLRGIPAAIRQWYHIPVLLYDGDLPASLPAYGGFATGFNIYNQAHLGEFDAIISNSKGGETALLELGASRVHTLYYAADPALYQPLPVAQDLDVFFYGHTAEYRRDWLHAMLSDPAERLPDVRFAARGIGLELANAVEIVPYQSFNSLRRYIARSRLNLVIVRHPHASLFGSSILRPFELAMMGACMVSNPWLGVEEWFEPEKEIIVVHSGDEAIERYRYLLQHEAERRAIGAAARERALAQHTYRQRAQQLLAMLEEYV